MTAHAAASTEDNALRGWTPLSASPDADLLDERDTIVGRNRDLIRNNGVAQGVQQTYVDNVVGGAGLRLSSRPKYKLLGRDKAWAREFGQAVESFHGLWWESTACDVCDESNGAGLTTQVLRSLFANGEACAIPMWMPEPGQLFATKLLLVEPDRLCNPNRRPDTPTLRAGVERDKHGKALAYHLADRHPGDRLAWNLSQGPESWLRIPAKTAWGRRQFLHVHDKDRSGATRSKPLIAAVMRPFKQLDHMVGTKLQTAIAQSLIAAFIETPLSQDALIDLFGGSAEAAQAYFDEKAKHDRATRLKGGAMIPLNPGDKATPFAPPNADNGFDQFTMTVYRQIAAGLNVPYELLVKDWTKTNYSSARAAMLEAWRYFQYLRNKVAFMFCQPAYELVLEEMVDRGMVEAPDFYALRQAYAASKWIGPGRGWVDPSKEIDAVEKRLRVGVSTLEMECAEQGLDWEEVLEQRALEAERCEELGLPSPYAPPPAPAGAQSPANKPADDESAEPQDKEK